MAQLTFTNYENYTTTACTTNIINFAHRYSWIIGIAAEHSFRRLATDSNDSSDTSELIMKLSVLRNISEHLKINSTHCILKPTNRNQPSKTKNTLQ